MKYLCQPRLCTNKECKNTDRVKDADKLNI